MFLAAAGFELKLAGGLAIAEIALGIFLHANVRWRLRPLQRIIVTPEFHHWHHVNELGFHHTNYASFFPVWDLLFGTYAVPPDRRPERYGISEPIGLGLIEQLRSPLSGMPPLRQLATAGFGHPVRTSRLLARSVRVVLQQMAVCVRRPTRSP